MGSSGRDSLAPSLSNLQQQVAIVPIYPSAHQQRMLEEKGERGIMPTKLGGWRSSGGGGGSRAEGSGTSGAPAGTAAGSPPSESESDA